MLGGTAALLLAAAAIMVATPLWITRRRKLQPLTAADAPAVVDEVAELAREQEPRSAAALLESARRVAPEALPSGIRAGTASRSAGGSS